MKTTAQPRFLYFDLGNVLVHFDHQLACRQVAEVAGVELDRVRRVLLDKRALGRYERGQVTTAEAHEMVCRRLGVHVEPERFWEAASRIFWLNMRLMPLVAQLRSAGYRLGILSNTSEAHWRYLRRYRMLWSCFSLHVLSFEEHAMKPEGTIYEAAARRCGVPAEEVFFVDDRPENVVGALEAGFDAVPYHSVSQLVAALRQRGLRFNY